MEARKVTYEHYIIEGHFTEGPHAGVKVWGAKPGMKRPAVAREQRHAHVFSVSTNDSITATVGTDALAKYQEAYASEPVEWALVRVNPASKGRI
ncbi:MAG: hypothetical protein M0R75_16040 [Dehalococcoidia bacterium]|nr:hypothetical protein [Dehalococcoidia bacterium]